MLAIETLGDFQADVLNLAKPLIDLKLVTRAKVISTYQSAMREIRTQATKGVVEGLKQEEPEITAKVRHEAETAVKPWVMGALAASGVAALLGVAAIVIAKRK
jgi:hypothetical protein